LHLICMDMVVALNMYGHGRALIMYGHGGCT